MASGSGRHGHLLAITKFSPQKPALNAPTESIYGSPGVVTFDYDGNLLDLDF